MKTVSQRRVHPFFLMVCYHCCSYDWTVQRERDVKESILFMAKQSGNLDPDVSLGPACIYGRLRAVNVFGFETFL